MRRKQPLPTSRGRRPGHPRPNAQTITAVEAARWLNTSPTTVCALVERDELDGYWVVAGKVYRHFVYVEAINRFCDEHGRFPAARSRPRVRPVELVSSTDGGHLRARILVLEQTVRSQQVAFEQQRIAFENQAKAFDLIRQAEHMQHLSAEAMQNAMNAMAEIGAVLGVPDFGPSS